MLPLRFIEKAQITENTVECIEKVMPYDQFLSQMVDVLTKMNGSNFMSDYWTENQICQ